MNYRDTVRISSDMRAFVDEMVETGEYKSRSDFYRSVVELFLTAYSENRDIIEIPRRVSDVSEHIIDMGYGVDVQDVLLNATLEYRDRCLEREKRFRSDSVRL